MVPSCSLLVVTLLCEGASGCLVYQGKLACGKVPLSTWLPDCLAACRDCRLQTCRCHGMNSISGLPLGFLKIPKLQNLMNFLERNTNIFYLIKCHLVAKFATDTSAPTSERDWKFQFGFLEQSKNSFWLTSLELHFEEMLFTRAENFTRRRNFRRFVTWQSIVYCFTKHSGGVHQNLLPTSVLMHKMFFFLWILQTKVK